MICGFRTRGLRLLHGHKLQYRHASTSSAYLVRDPPPPSLNFPFPPSALALHWDTTPPSPTALTAATSLFTCPSRLRWVARYYREVPYHDLPEVAFLSRSNSGKSSLINALMGKSSSNKLRQGIARTGSKAGVTKLLQGFEIGVDNVEGGRGKLVLVDTIGYGYKGWMTEGNEIEKFLMKRKQLKRVFVLINAEHGLKDTDLRILAMLREGQVSHQIILSKVDRILFPHTNTSAKGVEAGIHRLKQIMEELRPTIQPEGRTQGPPALGEIIACATRGRGGLLGIDTVRWAVCRAVGLEGVRGSKARRARGLQDLVQEGDDEIEDEDGEGNLDGYDEVEPDLEEQRPHVNNATKQWTPVSLRR